MTSIEDLISLVESQPTCQTFADMLVDELIAQRDCLHTEARAHVELVQQRAVQAAQLAEATNLMRADTRSGRILSNHFALTAGDAAASSTVVVLILGESPPAARRGDGHSWWGPNGVLTLTVGAGWVIRTWELLEQTRKIHRRARAISRRRSRTQY